MSATKRQSAVAPEHTPPRPTRPTDRRHFGIGIVCSLPTEAQTVRNLFDYYWDNGPGSEKVPGDPNLYSMGAIGSHNVVLVYLPGAGKVNAAHASAFLRHNFPSIQLVLLVGTCGAVPLLPESHDIVALGDVMISEGAIEYDMGKRYGNRLHRDTDHLSCLGRPKPEIMSLIAKLKGWRCREINQRPAVHFGLFATGDTVVASGSQRDRLAQKEGVVAFETEAAGVWDTFPCVVIKGVSNHADGRKQTEWQHYAAVAAASCAKKFFAILVT
ncbi:nucleoside phosphorylase domain-containing protein [Plectosphaerella plurivora]|uniref:Nucleoside phosphorylase domain-containing protein n=1 Tax=Plectosphaerella plurivora TaxID=936078 RepID=A0A9P8VLD0_9PEZI|nr:nucleoside phosphorylase domain-containing protein [Plectosphaerella plurivora]